MFFKSLIQSLKIKSVRHRLLFTLFILIVFRIGAHITTPGINASRAQEFADVAFLNQLSLISGNALKQFSLFALGISPYISASIITQVLQSDLNKTMTEWAKHGEVGRRKLNQVTRWLTVILGLIQGYGVLVSMHGLTTGGILRADTWQVYAIIIIAVTTGSLVLTWLSERITESGIGNGQTMIILVGILASLPEFIGNIYKTYIENVDWSKWTDVSVKNGSIVGGIVIGVVLLVFVTTYFHLAEHRSSIQYLNKPQHYGYHSYMPLKLNPAGVMPVIFASVTMTFPAMILNLMKMDAKWTEDLLGYFDMTRWRGMLIYAVLIIVFGWMYSFIQINPEKTAKQLGQSGSYIIGVRPGDETEKYMRNLIWKLSTIGSIVLTIIAILPLVITKLSGTSLSFALTGTSLLIVIAGSIDMTKQMNGFVSKRHYKDLF